ncbi:MAG: hypothetical protein JO293_03780, partial [Candidatus Eremiobacteraeota bacterium]|nr:hypothetical protein [Candidatus Eremiobacteraeota bacterium]
MSSLGWIRHAAAAAGVIASGLVLSSCTGAGTVAGPGRNVGPTVPPAHTLDNWVMYGHDSRHTSASAANVTGTLTQKWRYVPVPLAGNTFGGMSSAIATTTGVYAHYSQYGATVFAGGPSMDGLSTAGTKQWSYCEHRDYEENHWLSAIGSGVVLQDDGMPLLNISTGVLIKWLSSSYDAWGETIPDASGLYGTNTFIADGPQLFVYQINASNTVAWKALLQTGAKYSSDNDGGLLLSNGTLYYAASYTDPVPNPSGIYALNASTGAKVGYVATTPTSEMSADGNNIYLEEGSNTLVARAQSNLAKVWSVSLPSGSFGAPVIADGMVIVATFNGI